MASSGGIRKSAVDKGIPEQTNYTSISTNKITIVDKANDQRNIKGNVKFFDNFATDQALDCKEATDKGPKNLYPKLPNLIENCNCNKMSDSVKELEIVEKIIEISSSEKTSTKENPVSTFRVQAGTPLHSNVVNQGEDLMDVTDNSRDEKYEASKTFDPIPKNEDYAAPSQTKNSTENGQSSNTQYSDRYPKLGHDENYSIKEDMSKSHPKSELVWPNSVVEISPSLEERFEHYKSFSLFKWRGIGQNYQSSPSTLNTYWENLFRSLDTTDETNFAKSFAQIVNALQNLKNKIESGVTLKRMGDAILSTVQEYNRDANTDRWNFNLLNQNELKEMLIITVPIIVNQACVLDQLLAKPIPLLKGGKDGCIYVTQYLACSLLANAFFCSFHERKGNVPGINFFSLFESLGNERNDKVKTEKIKCMLNYFRRMSKEPHNGIISFERRVLQDHVKWADSQQNLSKVVTNFKDAIEYASNMLQMDFANKKIGGGVLHNGMVMEEIRFSIAPELIVSRLFTDVLGDDEVIVITGSEQFSNYSGYSSSFKFKGDYNDKQGKDELGRLTTQIVAIDALHFTEHDRSQYTKKCVDRELNKCYRAFQPMRKGAHQGKPIATGNWGCGAFNGDPQLKFLIQWLAASQAEQREMHYFTFQDRIQCDSINGIVSVLQNVTVGNLYKVLLQFEKENSRQKVFEFVHRYLMPKPERASEGNHRVNHGQSYH